ncbi:MAG: hypothetical protein HAW58_03630, partial [Candidatus Thioglobus sp.]|nr:hypothetical protein [Candidatus Thioglobus sp.]
ALFQGKFKSNHLGGDFALPTVSAYVNLNHKHHRIDPEKQLVKSSIFEYFGRELGENICDEDEMDKIIQEAGGLNEYKKYLKQASIAFADNKSVLLTEDDFEF